MSVTTGLTVSSERSPIERLAVNTIRTLAMDAVQKANSGHPGTPMAMAPVAYCLWQRFLTISSVVLGVLLGTLAKTGLARLREMIGV